VRHDVNKPLRKQKEMEVIGYKKNSLGTTLFIFLSLVSFGVLPLICFWNPKVFVYFTRVKSDLSSAELVGIYEHGSYKEADVMVVILKNKNMIYFEYKKQRYMIENNKYSPINAQLSGSCLEISGKESVTAHDAKECLTKYGYNTLDIDPKPLMELILAKISHPFYLFQSLSVFIWIRTGYFTFAFVILFSSIGSIINEVYLTRKAEKNLQELIPPQGDVTVVRDSKSQKIHASHLVVGDIIVLDEMKNVPGDVVVLKGQAVVDEASLTGESLPVVKNPIPNVPDDFKVEAFKNSIIFAGSDILLVKNDKTSKQALGRVYATGFSSTKGDLFKTLLFPKPLEFKFNNDAWKFLGILAIIGVLAFINRVIQQLGHGKSFWNTLLTSADLITIAVPPALPLVLTVGIVLSIERLKKSKIFCISPERVNFAGRIDTMCWDKTGTLTSPTLNFSGVDTFLKGTFSGFQNVDKLSPGMEMVMATCHSVNMVRLLILISGYVKTGGSSIGYRNDYCLWLPSGSNGPRNRNFGTCSTFRSCDEKSA
jgi:magnesium-transporting ATPase (P-type)